MNIIQSLKTLILNLNLKHYSQEKVSLVHDHNKFKMFARIFKSLFLFLVSSQPHNKNEKNYLLDLIKIITIKIIKIKILTL
jgi:hypothetical protein